MKYSQLSGKTAKEICRKIRHDCQNCPLRRDRIDEKGRYFTKVCFYVLYDIFKECQEQLDELKDEEIVHEDELKRYLSE